MNIDDPLEKANIAYLLHYLHTHSKFLPSNNKGGREEATDCQTNTSATSGTSLANTKAKSPAPRTTS